MGTFYEKELQKIKKEFRIEKVIRNRGDKVYVKWKEYDSSFNSWIDKKANTFLNVMNLLVETLISRLIYLRLMYHM